MNNSYYYADVGYQYIPQQQQQQQQQLVQQPQYALYQPTLQQQQYGSQAYVIQQPQQQPTYISTVPTQQVYVQQQRTLAPTTTYYAPAASYIPTAQQQVGWQATAYPAQVQQVMYQRQQAVPETLVQQSSANLLSVHHAALAAQQRANSWLVAQQFQQVAHRQAYQRAVPRMRYSVIPHALVTSHIQGVTADALQAAVQQKPPVHAVPTYLLKFYEVLGKIGEGTYGVVYLARSKGTQDRLLAVKTFKTGREGDGVSLTAIREIMLLRELNHPNIVRLDSVHINRQDPCLSLAFDYAEHDLYEMIRHHRGGGSPLDYYTVKSITWQLLKGLAYLHENWIVHRDLKPSNLLVIGEGAEQGCVKVADFGLARVFRDPLRTLADNGVVVTIWYRAPELLLGARHYTPAIDMWAAGCIVAELLMLRPLFQGDEVKSPSTALQVDQLERILRVMGRPNAARWPLLEALPHWKANTENIRHRVPDSPNQLDECILAHCRVQGVVKGCSLLHLVRQLLEYNPEDRLTAFDALEHAVFKEEPLPGMNSFKYQGRVVAKYPRRANIPPSTNANAGEAAGAAAAAGATNATAQGTNPAGAQGNPSVSPYGLQPQRNQAAAAAPAGEGSGRGGAAGGRKRKNDASWGPGFR